jgi:geranylgeranyl pyrophosphate synthase
MNTKACKQPTIVNRINNNCSTEVAQALTQALTDLPASLKEPARFHFMKLGKLLRGTVAYQTATVFGLPADIAGNWSVAVELLHNASLIHDDICDGDLHRRGQESVSRKYGSAVALCLGDYLIAKAFATAAKIDDQLPNLLSNSIITLTEGQAGEFMFVGYPGWNKYKNIATSKTAPLLSLSVMGVLILSGSQIKNETIESYFNDAALCFQIINDLNNFSGEDGANNPCSDLLNCRPNAVLACYRDSLSMDELAHFENWAMDIRSGALIADTVKTRSWWHKIRNSEAFSVTKKQLQIHFQKCESRLETLDTINRVSLEPIHTWLLKKIEKLDYQKNKKRA